MREHFEPFKAGDIAKAEPLEKLNKLSRRLSGTVGGENLKSRSTGHSTSISAPPKFVQGPLQVVKLPDPNSHGHDGERLPQRYQVRPVIRRNGVWVVDNDSGPYPLDASVSNLKLAITDRISGYWHSAAQVFLPISSTQQAQVQLCKVYADFDSLYPVTIDQGTGGFNPDSESDPTIINSLAYPPEITVNPWVQFELQRSDGPEHEDDFEYPDRWQWWRVNDRRFFLAIARGIRSENEVTDEYDYFSVASGKGVYTAYADKGGAFYRIRVYGHGDPEHNVKVHEAGLRIRLVGPAQRIQTDAADDFQPVNETNRVGVSPALTLEQSAYNLIKATDADIERLGNCPFFRAVTTGATVIEAVIPLPAAEIVVDENGQEVQTQEQKDATTALSDVYYATWAFAVEIWITAHATFSEERDPPPGSDNSSSSSISDSSKSSSSSSSVSTSSSSRSSSSSSSLSSWSSFSSSSSSSSSLSSMSSSSSSSYSSESSSSSSLSDGWSDLSSESSSSGV